MIGQEEGQCGQTWGEYTCKKRAFHSTLSHLDGDVRWVVSNRGNPRAYDPAIDSKSARAARKPPRPQEPEHYTEADYDTWLRL